MRFWLNLCGFSAWPCRCQHPRWDAPWSSRPLAHNQGIAALDKSSLFKKRKYGILGNFADGRGWMESWRPLVILEMIISRFWVCLAWEPSPRRMAWEQRAVIPPKHTTQTCSVTEQGGGGCWREEVYSPWLCGYSKNSLLWKIFFSLNLFFINLHLFVLVPVLFLSLNSSSLSLVFTPLMYL